MNTFQQPLSSLVLELPKPALAPSDKGRFIGLSCESHRGPPETALKRRIWMKPFGVYGGKPGRTFAMKYAVALHQIRYVSGLN